MIKSFYLLIFGLFLFHFASAQNKAVSIYNRDSTLVGTGVMVNNKMDGLWRFEDTRTNKLIQEGMFQDGMKDGTWIVYHPNANKKTEATYKNNQLNGAYKDFDADGALILEMILKDSVMIGPYKQYYGRTGRPSHVNPKQVLIEGQHKNGKKHGEWLSYYENGQLGVKQTFVEGVLDGPYLEYSPYGQLIIETTYKNNKTNGVFKRYSFGNTLQQLGEYELGKRVGKWVSYYPETNIIESESYYDERGNKTGTWTYYYENRRVARIERYENDIAVGIWEEFFPNRSLSKRQTYDLGVPVGEYIEYHQNGEISVSGQYNNGAKTGLWKNFYPDGRVYSIGEYHLDLKSGNWKYFNKIGILIAEGDYNLGSEHGQWVYYYDGGQLKSIGSYYLGLEDGTWGLFYDNKQLTQEETWDNGRLMAVSNYYSYDGATTLDPGTLKSGEGSRITYYINGTKESEGSYRFGKAHGEWRYYHDNGRLASEGTMENGQKEGAWKYYGRNGALTDLIQFEADEMVPEEMPKDELMFQNFQ